VVREDAIRPLVHTLGTPKDEDAYLRKVWVTEGKNDDAPLMSTLIAVGASSESGGTGSEGATRILLSGIISFCFKQMSLQNA
jgi:hypothetical protein